LRWDDFDAKAATLSINRRLVAVDYELHETRGKTANARRRIDLDPTTVGVLTAWQTWQGTEQQEPASALQAGCSPMAVESRSTRMRSARPRVGRHPDASVRVVPRQRVRSVRTPLLGDEGEAKLSPQPGPANVSLP